jgi:hypothetical protein
VHLVLGHPDDSCCVGVLAKFRERGLPACLLPDLLTPPARLTWHLDEAGLDSCLALDGVSPETISSVLVRHAGWLEPAGWDPADHAYMQAETQATLLAWLAGLPCPVINRASAALWYRPRMPMLAWRPLLRRVGLPTPEILVTNDPARARDFGRRLEADGAGGAVFTPLTGDSAFLVTGSDWSGLATLQEFTPVCLTEPHGPAQSACIVGHRIIWDGAEPRECGALASSFARLAEATGLSLIEVAVAPVRCGRAIVLVEPHAQLDHFRASARERILHALVDLLTDEAVSVCKAEETSS